MTDFNGKGPHLPPQDITDEEKSRLGILPEGPVIKLIHRPSLTARKQAKIQAVSLNEEQYKQAFNQARTQILWVLGFDIMNTILQNEDKRLVPIPYQHKSVRHDFDMSVQFYECAGPGKWGMGVRYTEAPDSNLRSRLYAIFEKSCLEKPMCVHCNKLAKAVMEAIMGEYGD